MKPQNLVKFAFACLITSGILLPSCSKENTGAYLYPGNVNPGIAPTVIDLQLTASTSNTAFNKVNVDLRSIEYNTSSEAGIIDGWEQVSLRMSGSIDLMSLINGRSTRLTADMLPGNARQLRMRLGSNNSVEVDGAVKMLTISNELQESGIILYFDMQQSTQYANSLWLNFNLNESIHHDAVNDQYILTPSFGSFDEHQTGSIEGFVMPADAKATIYINGDPNNRNFLVTEFSIAEEQNMGYFRFVGLPVGKFQLEMIAGDGTNRTKVISDIEVKAGEITQIGTNELE